MFYARAHSSAHTKSEHPPAQARALVLSNLDDDDLSVGLNLDPRLAVYISVTHTRLVAVAVAHHVAERVVVIREHGSAAVALAGNAVVPANLGVPLTTWAVHANISPATQNDHFLA